MAGFLISAGDVDLLRARLKKYFDQILVDEIQDFAGYDFNLLFDITAGNLGATFVGDFFQHTFDTSRDGGVNRNLHKDYEKYIGIIFGKGFDVDVDTLGRSYRSSPSVCRFIADEIGIEISSHRDDNTSITYITDSDVAASLFEDYELVKLFYQSHNQYLCYSDNWGASKGIDHFGSVCVVLNKKTDELFKKRLVWRICG